MKSKIGHDGRILREKRIYDRRNTFNFRDKDGARPDGPGRRHNRPRRHADALCRICNKTRKRHMAPLANAIQHEFELSVAPTKTDPPRRREAIEHTRKLHEV